MCSKHVEAWNKLIIKFSASSWSVLRNKYIEMNGQQFIKKKNVTRCHIRNMCIHCLDSNKFKKKIAFSSVSCFVLFEVAVYEEIPAVLK